MPVPHHLDMMPRNRYEDLDDAPVDPVFDYEVEPSRDGDVRSRHQQTPYYSRDPDTKGRWNNPDHASNRRQSRNTTTNRSYSNDNNNDTNDQHNGYKQSKANYPDAVRGVQPSGYPSKNNTERDYSFSPVAESRTNHRHPGVQKTNKTYDLVRNEDLYADEDYVEYNNKPLYRDRNQLLGARGRSDPVEPNGRIFVDDDNNDDEDFDEDDDDMETKLRRGDNNIHRGQLVTFYRNGDPIYKGLQTGISRKLFPTFETLVIWLNEKIQTTCGVRYIFALATGREVRELGEFRAGEKYVVSSSRSLLRVNYGKNTNIYWRNRALSAGKIRKAEIDIYRRIENRTRKSRSYPGSRAGSDRSPFAKYPLGLKPRILTIRNNLHRDRIQKVILNPKTTQSFEEMLRDIGEMLQVPGEERLEAQALYTAKPPYRKVQSFSQLADILGTLRTSEKKPELVCNEFIACGKEKFPTEMLLKNRKHNKEAISRHNGTNPNHVPKQPALIPDTFIVDDEPVLPSESDRDIQDQSPTSGSNAEISAIENGSVMDDPLGQSHDDFRQSQDALNQSSNQSGWSRNPKQVASPRSRATKRATGKDKPFRKSMPELESIKVHIHGHLREFFVPRYGQFDNEGLLPDEDIELNWVYGYHGTDAINNLYTLISGEFLYNVASVVVIYSKSREKQRHYIEHTEDITCINLLDDGASARVASGQKSNKYGGNLAHIRIWDPFSMTTQCVIGTNFFQNAVLSVAFSNYTGNYKKGSLLLAIDDSPRHMLSVWDWEKGEIIAKTPAVIQKTSIDKVTWGSFHPDDHQTIITFGKQHIYFWWLDWKPNMTGTPRILRDKQSGLMPINDLPMYVTSIAFSPALPSSIKRSDRPSVGEVITGDSNGCITVWQRDDNDAYVINHRCSEAMKHAHNKPVFSLCMMKEGTLLSGGGGEIKAWDTTNNYRPIKSRNNVTDAVVQIPEDCGTVRAMVPRITSSTDGTLYIGTTTNSILEGSLQEKFSIVVQGHSEELWALDTHPTEQVFVSAGYDQYVTKWSMQTHKPLWKSYIEDETDKQVKPGMSVAFNPAGNLIVVGTSLGRFIVLNAQNGQHITSVQVASDLEALDGIKYSPDGRLLAMGCHDGNIYLYKSEDDGKVYRRYPHDRSGVFKGHSNSVQYLDWSNDSKYLQSVSADYDLLCWDLKQMKETPAEMTREVQWATQTCVLNYNTLGAWSNLKEGEDITSLDRSKQMNTVAIGDNQGSISIYRFPCSSEKPECHRHKAYSGRINKLAYSSDDRYLVTSGGTDAGLMQWVIV